MTNQTNRDSHKVHLPIRGPEPALLQSLFTIPIVVGKAGRRDTLQLYVVVSEHALSSVLIKEEEKVQRLVYYILENPSKLGRIVKWAIELSEFDLRYKPNTSIKAQALADFVVECTNRPNEEAPELINLIEASQEKVWLLYVDGACNPGNSGAGILLWSLEGNKIEYALLFTFKSTNNEAEYEALVNWLTLQTKDGFSAVGWPCEGQF
ncbi:hypothetical protein LIER_20552 [Lithospermum erythrorhizon]|uniref:RNase H type-1 domain-containing protein n=1 Tax=Lithospermum erythrorhizon TaxID=34254 RepID=A0AAV3QMY7_LITER